MMRRKTAQDIGQLDPPRHALYAAMLQKLYPQRAIRTALLWTETPELMEILPPARDAELASLAGGTAKLDPATAHS